ncbi:MAG TPA: PrsW family glutamic-type intramembrane protease [Thermoanaerobaculia bacterium]|nr:PrsW family glutamic-type intramembrane protease [Thermoanaerobaculia bacterium]
MVLRLAASLALGLLPVLTFVFVLVLLDSYKLVPPRRVVRRLALGALAAVASLGVHALMDRRLGLDAAAQARYLAPVAEELLKGTALVALLARRRVGFLVDAAISGFAIGAGFAAVENLHYLATLRDTSLVLWTVRGFGTAVMHGSTLAIMAVVAKSLSDRRGTVTPATVLPGWGLAVVLHSLFNHFLVSPNASAALLLVALPAFFGAVFRVSEARTRTWLGTSFDTDQELLALVNAGRVSDSRIGRYLAELERRLPGTVVADLVCLLRLRLELAIRAKGILIMRKAGFRVPPDPDFGERFAELRYLERAVGPTALRALAPALNLSDRDLWQYELLDDR